MKKLFLGLIFLNLYGCLILGMEKKQEEDNNKVLFEFSHLDPELQVYTIEQGIQARLNSNSNPIEAVLDALKYLLNITSANKSLSLLRESLLIKLQKAAKEKFAPEYAHLSMRELNLKLNDVIQELHKKKGTYQEIIKDPSANAELNEVAKLILAGADPNFEPDYKLGRYIIKNLLLNRAIYYGDVNLIRLLIAYGANLDQSDIKGMTPLMEVVSVAKNLGIEKTKKIIDLLIKYGADVNIKTHRGSAIGEALSEGNPDITSIFLDHHAIPSSNDFARLREFIEFYKEEGQSQTTEKNRIEAEINLQRAESIIPLLQQYGYKLD